MMITKINKFALLLLMVCCSISVSAAVEAEYKKLAKSWTLNEDGSQEFRYNMELTLFTHAAMNSKYGESFIVYNPQYQTLTINESYTKQKDGSIIKTPANAFVEVLPRNAADAPAYNQLKEMVVVHTGLELGATIYLDYTVTSKPGYLPELDIFEIIQQSSPVREYTFTLATPTNKTVSYTLTNSKVKAIVKEDAKKRVTSWTMRNVPQLSTSANVQVSNGDIPFLAATTYADAKTALSTLNNQMDTVNDNIQTLVAEVTKGVSSNENKIQKIVEFVGNELSFNSLTLQQTGYRFRPVSEVLATAYGTEAEKANLLAMMLKTAGLRAEVVIGYPVKATQGLALTAIDHLYVAVDGGKYIFAVNTLARPERVVFNQSPLYSVKDGKPVQVEAASKYQIVGNQSLSVSDKQWVIDNNETIGEDLLPYFADGKVAKESRISMNVHHGYATLVLKESAYGVSTLGYGHLNSIRKGNLLLPRLVDEMYTYEITCPQNMELRTPAGITEIHNAAGDLVISVDKEGQKATVTRSLKLKKQLFTPSEYKAVRDLLTTWSDVNGKTLLFLVK